MEPITTAAAISAVVGYLAKTIKDNKTVSDFFSDFTSASVNWIKPLFLKDDGEPKEAIEKLKEKPESEARQNNIKSLLEIALEDSPDYQKLILEIAEKIQEKAKKGESVKIVNSKNVNTGNVNTGGGNVVLGDNNNIFQDIRNSQITLH